MDTEYTLTARDLTALGGIDAEKLIAVLRRKVSGTYRNDTPADGGRILELRVDVDGRRPQDRLSGDLYDHVSLCGFPITLYRGSFVVEDVTVDSDADALVASGPVIHYADPGNTDDAIEVHIPRASLFSSAPAACVRWRTNGVLVRSYMCPKTSEYFRTATLEVDCFQGTSAPPELDPGLDPSPSDLPDTVSVAQVFERSGIDLAVVLDDVLNDADSDDPGTNWNNVELHDLMETRFDQFANIHQWNLYGVVVPRFGDPGYNPGAYGVMFDWGGYQAGDSFLRQGLAVADDAIRGRTSGGLYDTTAERDRLALQTFIHEVGHAFNLPHSWQRTDNPDSGSESFMNYPWGYTDNGGGESAFWSNFRWEFDDVELRWMRHADRNDVIFGGRDWIGNNLAIDLHPDVTPAELPLTMRADGPTIVDFGVPVQLEVQVENTSDAPVEMFDRLDPEDGLLQVYIQRPSGDIVAHLPPVRRLLAPPEPVVLAPGEVRSASIDLSFAATGHQFAQPGEYLVRFVLPCFPFGFLATTSTRLRVAHPQGRPGEELAHLLTRREAATFLYYGGTSRHPEVVDELTEAAERFAETEPMAVRHIRAALGRHAGRTLKYVEADNDGRRVVKARTADHEAAVGHLEKACEALPDEYGRVSAFDDLASATLVGRLADSLHEVGRDDDARRRIRETIEGLEGRGASPSAIVACRSRLDTLGQ